MPVTPVDPPLARRALAAPALVAAPFGRAMATVGHVRRAGRWALPRRFRAVAWMGGVDLDLTEADIPPGGAVLEVLAVLGVVTVRVPAALSVELFGDAVTWSADGRWAPIRAAAQSGECVALRIVGRAVLGKIHVHAVGPDRSAPRAAG